MSFAIGWTGTGGVSAPASSHSLQAFGAVCLEELEHDRSAVEARETLVAPHFFRL
jgi:hypothetical protein